MIRIEIRIEIWIEIEIEIRMEWDGEGLRGVGVGEDEAVCDPVDAGRDAAHLRQLLLLDDSHALCIHDAPLAVQREAVARPRPARARLQHQRGARFDGVDGHVLDTAERDGGGRGGRRRGRRRERKRKRGG